MVVSLLWMLYTCRPGAEHGQPFGVMVYTIPITTHFGTDAYTGPNWPAGGEIDIIEGVNDYTNNQATLHTNPGCGLASTDSKALSISGTLIGGTDCAVSSTSNQGCGIRSESDTTYGEGFNSIGGGVYASEFPVPTRCDSVADAIGTSAMGYQRDLRLFLPSWIDTSGHHG